MITEKARSIVELDARLAQEKLKNLTTQATQLRAEINRLGEIPGNDAKIKKLEKEAKSVETQMRRLKKETQDTSFVLKNLSGVSYDQLSIAHKRSLSELKKLEPGTAAYNQKLKETITLAKQKSIADTEMNSAMGKNHSTLSKLSNGFNKYFGMLTAGIAAITGITYTLKSTTKLYAELTDLWADVAKTTGLATEEVKELDKALMKIDTRTSREQLLSLARDAGKLGISAKEDVEAFVKAADQIQVALGEDLGEGAIRNIGKIADVFGLTKDLGIEQAYLKIGSSINELGAASTASEQYLVDFTQRLSGVGKQANLSVQDILGYASALDQSGQAVEMSATALQKFIMKLMEDPAKFAKIAGLEVEKFNTLLKEDTNEAIITVLSSLSERGGFQQLIPVFKDMGLDGARAVGVLSSMASNITAVREAQDLSNKSFKEGISLTNEFNIKNNTAQAERDKAMKRFKERAVELGEILFPLLTMSTNAGSYLIKALLGIIQFTVKYKGVLTGLLITIGTYIVLTKTEIALKKLVSFWNEKILTSTIAQTVREKALAIQQAAGNAVLYLKQLAYDVLTKKITLAYAAQEAFTLAFKKTPWGLVFALITGGGYALYNYAQKVKAVREEQERQIQQIKNLGDISEKYQSLMAQERVQLDLLFDALKKTTKGSKERQDIIDKINSNYGTTLKNLDDEKLYVEQITIAYDELIKKIDEKAKMQAAEDALVELYKKRNELQITAQKEYEKRLKLEAKQAEISARRVDANYDKTMANMAENAKKMQGVFDAPIEPTKEVTEAIFKQKIAVSSIKEQWDAVEESINNIKGLVTLPDTTEDVTKKPKTPFLPPDDDKKTKGKWSLDSDEAFLKAKMEIQLKYYQGEIKTEEEFNEQLYALEVNTLTKRIFLNKESGLDLLKLQGELEEKRFTHQKKINEQCEKEDKELNDKREKYAQAFSDAIFEEESRRAHAITKKYTDLIKQAQETGNENNIPQLEARRDEELKQEALAREKKFLEEKNRIRKEYELISIAEMQAEEMNLLQTHFNNKLLTEEEYERAKKFIQDKYRELAKVKDQAVLDEKLKSFKENLAKIQALESISSGMIDSLHESQFLSLENAKNKELKLAGDNAEERERIENEYAQKEFELKKKQADANMGIQIAQIIAATALGVMTTISQFGLPWGLIPAAAVAATGAIQIANAVAQRNAIQSAVFESQSSSSGSSGDSSGVLRAVSAFHDGGYTGNGDENEVAGITHKDEYVVPKIVMKEPKSFNHVRALEAIRQEKGISSNPLPGFKDGGFSGDSENSTSAAEGGLGESTIDRLVDAIMQFINMMNRIEKNGIQGVWSWERWKKTTAQMDKIETRNKK